MTITRVGATEKYASGWDRAFGRKKKETAAKPAARAAKHGTVAGKKPAAAKKKSAARKAT